MVTLACIGNGTKQHVVAQEHDNGDVTTACGKRDHGVRMVRLPEGEVRRRARDICAACQRGPSWS